jgi:hypothetical protein
MYSLLVLGFIPGTNIQISFTTWLWSFALVAVSFTLQLKWQNRTAVVVTPRPTLYASQLHQRARSIHRTVAALPADTVGRWKPSWQVPVID